MNKMRKGVAILSVAAMLIFCLVPVAMAAPAATTESPAAQASILKGYVGYGTPVENPNVEEPMSLTGYADRDMNTIAALLYNSNGAMINMIGAKITFACTDVSPADNSKAILAKSRDQDPSESVSFTSITTNLSNPAHVTGKYDAGSLKYDDNDTVTYTVTCSVEPPEGASYSAPAPLTYTIRIGDKGAVVISPEEATIVTGDEIMLTATVLGVNNPTLTWTSDTLTVSNGSQPGEAMVEGDKPGEGEVQAKVENIAPLPDHSATAKVSVTELQTGTELPISVEAGTTCPTLMPAWSNGAPTYLNGTAIDPDQLTYTWVADGLPADAAKAVSDANASGANTPAALSGLTFPEAGSYSLTLSANTADGEQLTTVSYLINVTPAIQPTAEPTTEPTAEPTTEPTAEPTTEPTAEPTAEPTTEPTAEPTTEPTAEPDYPTYEPIPTTYPTVEPIPTYQPTPVIPAPSASIAPVERLVLTSDAPDEIGLEDSENGTPRTVENVAIDETPTAQTAEDWFLDYPDAHAEIVAMDGDRVGANEPLATGMEVHLVRNSDGALLDTADVVVDGDVLGTGTMSLTQLVRLADAMIGKRDLSGAFFEAGDLNHDGAITLTDLVNEARMFREKFYPEV